MYISYAVLLEGASDRLYFNVLLPRVMADLVARTGRVPAEIPELPSLSFGSTGRDVETVANEACDGRDAFDLLFIHSDEGGRSLRRSLNARTRAYCSRVHEICEFPPSRCVVAAPRRETEAWVLADREAVMSALGFRARPDALGLPANALAAEGLPDPKGTLVRAITRARGRRHDRPASTLFPAIAQRQSLDALRHSASYRRFEDNLRRAMIDLGALQAQ
jgi:hypothetical protein